MRTFLRLFLALALLTCGLEPVWAGGETATACCCGDEGGCPCPPPPSAPGSQGCGGQTARTVTVAPEPKKEEAVRTRKAEARPWTSINLRKHADFDESDLATAPPITPSDVGTRLAELGLLRI